MATRSKHVSPASVAAVSDLESLWCQLELARNEIVPRPALGITVAEYMERFECSRSIAQRELEKIVTAGKMSVVKCNIPIDGVRRRTKVFVPA